MSATKLQQALDAVPFLSHAEITVIKAQPGVVTLGLKGGTQIRDHAGHIHSAALFALGEAAASVAIRTHPELVKRTPLQRASGIRYLKPCPEVPLATAEITEIQIQAMRASTSNESKMEVVVPICDDAGLRVAEVVSVFILR